MPNDPQRARPWFAMLIFRWLRCALFGHATEPTGLHGGMIHQVRCFDCGRLFVAHLDHPTTLLPWTAEWETRFGEKWRGNAQ